MGAEDHPPRGAQVQDGDSFLAYRTARQAGGHHGARVSSSPPSTWKAARPALEQSTKRKKKLVARRSHRPRSADETNTKPWCILANPISGQAKAWDGCRGLGGCSAVHRDTHCAEEKVSPRGPPRGSEPEREEAAAPRQLASPSTL